MENGKSVYPKLHWSMSTKCAETGAFHRCLHSLTTSFSGRDTVMVSIEFDGGHKLSMKHITFIITCAADSALISGVVL